MGSNGKDEAMVSLMDAAECSDATVEIKIKTLDSQTYTLRVDKCVPVPTLKDQVANVTGVVSEQQRLICRGKVLRDDQLLSAYHVEDGHTLHLVVRQPIPLASESFLDNPDPASSAGHSLGGHSGSSVLVGTFNISEQGDGGFPDINRIVSAVLNSFGVSGPGLGSDGVDLRESGVSWLPRTPGLTGLREPGSLYADQAATMGQSTSLSGTSPFLPTAAASLGPMQPLVILDSLATLSRYLSSLSNEFTAVTRDNNNSGITGIQANNVQEPVATSQDVAGQGRLPTPALLAEVMASTLQMLVEQASECILQLTVQLQNHSNVTDSLARAAIQSNAIRSGTLLQNLGALLLELGRTTMTLQMGQSPADAIVNAGPAVFISTSGPNPIMVQPLPFHPGTSFGSIPMGTLQAGSGASGGTLGSNLTPRNIDIRIRAGTLLPTGVSTQRESSTGTQQSPGQDAANPEGAHSAHQAPPRGSVAPSSARQAEVRVMPIRTVVTAAPAHIRRTPSDPARSSVGLMYPVLARVHNVSSEGSNGARGSEAAGERRPSGLGPEQQPITVTIEQQQNSTHSGGDDNGPSSGVPEGLVHSAIQNRLDQFLRALFPGEEIQFSGDFNSQGPTTSSATQNEETTAATAAATATATAPATTTTLDEALRAVDEGTYFSNMLHQIMPYISENTENQHAQASSAQGEMNVGESSCRRGDSPSPDPKRQKRE